MRSAKKHKYKLWMFLSFVEIDFPKQFSITIAKNFLEQYSW